MTETGHKPLMGIRVLDLTNVLAGPYCCYQLALMGAEVIKVERPGTGDLARQLGADPARNELGMGISFLAQNAGKRSVTLNMKSPEGKALLKRLAASADVLVENFRPGVMDRLELGQADLRADNDTLIYCAISGFGQDGPWKDNPAYDQIVQGVSGMMSITGDANSAPLRAGYPLADTLGGMTAAFSICAALNAKPRGAFLDISMNESVISSMGWVVSNFLIGGVLPVPQGNENMTSAPSGTFRVGDGVINISANRDEQWEALARELGRDDLLNRDDYATREERKRNRLALRNELEKTLMQHGGEHWVARLNAIGVPCGPVLGVPDALGTTQLGARGLVGTLGVGDETLQLLGSPVMVDGKRSHADLVPPSLGADNDAVYGELGISADQLDALRKDGVI